MRLARVILVVAVAGMALPGGGVWGAEPAPAVSSRLSGRSTPPRMATRSSQSP